MPTDTEPLEMTEVQWQVADEIARKLVNERTDVNELRKIITYLREYVERENAGKAFFDYLKILASRGDQTSRGKQIGHSGQTINHYESLNAACKQYLKDYQDKAPQMLMILGWAARLMKYYSEGVPTGELLSIVVMSEREAEIQAVTRAHTFEVGQERTATVVSVKGNKVTYEILGTIRLSTKEPKLAEQLIENQQITVRIEALKDDGSIKRVKGIQ